MHAQWKRVDDDSARVLLRGAPAWLGPALRKTMVHDVPVLAFDEYEEHWRQGPLPSEVVWHRILQLPLVTGWPPLRQATGTLDAWNVLHSFSVTRTHAVVFVSLAAASARDVLRDGGAPPFAAVGERLSLAICGSHPCHLGFKDDVGRWLVAQRGGPWTVTAAGSQGVTLSADADAATAALSTWSLQDMARCVWRPLWRQGSQVAWCACIPSPAQWRAAWEPVRSAVVFRLAVAGDSVAEDDACTAAVAGLGVVGMSPEVDGLRLRHGPGARAVVRYDNSDGAPKFELHFEEGGALGQLGEWAAHRWSLSCHDDAVLVRRYTPASQDVVVNAGAIQLEPPHTRPAGDASWDSIPLCTLRRGHGIRVSLRARLGCGSHHARWAAALCGSPVFRPPMLANDGAAVAVAAAMGRAPEGAHPSPGDVNADLRDRGCWDKVVDLPVLADEAWWDITAESAGQLPALQLLAAAGDTLRDGFTQAAAAFRHGVEGPPPEASYPARNNKATFV